MRFFHWLTAGLVLTMLGIGLAMVASLANYHRLVSIHRPLGVLILIVVVISFREPALLRDATIPCHYVGTGALACFGV
jgi:cytochrome b561